MKFKINISPGMIIFILGFCGLIFSLADPSSGIGGKVPLTLFFLFIIILGIIIESKMKDNIDTFGEMEGGGFG